MGTSEDWYVHWDPDCIRFVQAHPKVALSTQKQENENSDVHQTNTSYNNRRTKLGKKNSPKHVQLEVKCEATLTIFTTQVGKSITQVGKSIKA